MPQSIQSRVTILQEIIEAKSKYPIRATIRNTPITKPSFENFPFIIAEIKRSSPSLGNINDIPSPQNLAKDYLNAGANAISILCEKDYFKGDLEDLQEVKTTYPNVCVLRKDFITQIEQIQESYDFGADMLLLITALFVEQVNGFNQLKKLYEQTLALGLTPLLEVHNKEEIDFLKPLKPLLIGINSRNLHNFKIDKIAAYNLLFYAKEQLNSQVLFESSINSSFDGFIVGNIGFDGILCGSYLVKSPNAYEALNALKYSVSVARNSPNAFYQNVFRILQSPLGFLKICGITTKEDALMCAKALENHLGGLLPFDKIAALGFIFIKDSPRFVLESVIREISQSLKDYPKILKIIVIQDDKESMQQAIKLYEEGIIDALQLHGVCGESFGGISLKAANFPFYEVWNIEKPSDFNASISPFVLFDSKSILGGGSGVSIDKEVLQSLKAKVDNYLCVAGGVGIDNIQQYKNLGAKMLDVNSSLESTPAKKDSKKLQAFLEKFTSLITHS
ncbi:bifunctional indole-3-glycerol phosphate synthase/phosphoribosylanthranilate isomerase [Helicobacter apodemus]|uniref:N-(5'-phosphoribosyl)anthranilate isomerase n=1 Tax=Helicobacter apodemus TaxID=135569 RepID=A0A4U8UGX6_9HELI|nr:bifunctional indole-3-glycerol phosphate synthase/phosphoribosylanthranilate isomerase [Helicobacter apodemus]TLE17033.1 bifunctional indole-3-glycerol phosphate synthase/phosphoribosylanthranilate isomerase [Helicobacter apodemus]